MRVARVRVGDTTHVTEVDGDEHHVLRGWPAAPTRTGRVLDAGAVQLLAPVTPTKVVAVGRNYAAHVEEMGYDAPREPSVFIKPPSSVIGPGKPIVLPRPSLSDHVEHEAELAIVIGRRLREVAAPDALAYVAGYTCANDVSARDLQRRDPYPTRGKGFDTFCPLGPWIETDLDLASAPSVRCRVNGELRQDGTTAQMITTVPDILAFVSAVMTLEPGDVVLTGSPGGSAALVDGDLVEVEIAGIGTLTNPVVRAG